MGVAGVESYNQLAGYVRKLLKRVEHLEDIIGDLTDPTKGKNVEAGSFWYEDLPIAKPEERHPRHLFLNYLLPPEPQEQPLLMTEPVLEEARNDCQGAKILAAETPDTTSHQVAIIQKSFQRKEPIIQEKTTQVPVQKRRQRTAVMPQIQYVAKVADVPIVKHVQFQQIQKVQKTVEVEVNTEKSIVEDVNVDSEGNQGEGNVDGNNVEHEDHENNVNNAGEGNFDEGGKNMEENNVGNESSKNKLNYDVEGNLEENNLEVNNVMSEAGENNINDANADEGPLRAEEAVTATNPAEYRRLLPLLQRDADEMRSDMRQLAKYPKYLARTSGIPTASLDDDDSSQFFWQCLTPDNRAFAGGLHGVAPVASHFFQDYIKSILNLRLIRAQTYTIEELCNLASTYLVRQWPYEGLGEVYCTSAHSLLADYMAYNFFRAMNA